jgi:hypothetical protein
MYLVLLLASITQVHLYFIWVVEFLVARKVVIFPHEHDKWRERENFYGTKTEALRKTNMAK